MKAIFYSLFSILALCGTQAQPAYVRNISTMQPAAASASAPTPDILRWDMTDGSGTTITATVGPNGDTDAAWTSGWLSGGALDFNGTSHDGATVSSVDYSTNIITIAFPLWLDATNSTRVILESSANFNSTENAFSVLLDGGYISAFVQNSGGYRTASATGVNLVAGQWFSVLIVFDNSSGSSLNKIFYNAVDASPTASSAAFSGNLSSQTLFIAARNRASLWMDGKIGKLWIYSGDRSADAVDIANAMK